MRKLQMAVLRSQAEKTKGYKTIKLFRHLWNEQRIKQGKAVADKPAVKKSMLQRTISNAIKKLKKGDKH